jgi:hypothetical protein
MSNSLAKFRSYWRPASFTNYSLLITHYTPSRQSKRPARLQKTWQVFFYPTNFRYRLAIAGPGM